MSEEEGVRLNNMKVQLEASVVKVSVVEEFVGELLGRAFDDRTALALVQKQAQAYAEEIKGQREKLLEYQGVEKNLQAALTNVAALEEQNRELTANLQKAREDRQKQMEDNARLMEQLNPPKKRVTRKKVETDGEHNQTQKE